MTDNAETAYVLTGPGSISTANIIRGDIEFVIVNGYTQRHWRGPGIKADYAAIRSVMRQVKTNFPGRRIGYPQIGAGLAGGNWSEISAIIEHALQGEDHTLVLFQPNT